ncbi:hypothetical protein SO802_030434 [Lithocarpus litseifolius]|uniref:Uncharacterized protein n=1 Tax=Lithocarpus litseifolius TaxID=425828 RepID=A0AAW2BJ98_9ROSI
MIILTVGKKLQVILTKMGLRIQERGGVVKGTPLVQPGDDLFWFNRPRLIIYLIHFVLFQHQFGLKSCFHEQLEDVISSGYLWGPHTDSVQLCDSSSICFGNTGGFDHEANNLQRKSGKYTAKVTPQSKEKHKTESTFNQYARNPNAFHVSCPSSSSLPR